MGEGFQDDTVPAATGRMERMGLTSVGDLVSTGSLIIFASVALGSLGVPVPALAAVIFVGSMLASEHATVAAGIAIFVAGMVGAVLGDTVWFLAGRRYGMRVLSLVCRMSLSRNTCVRRTSEVFRRHGMKLLLFARFVPGLSVVTAPLAGLSAVSLARFWGFAEVGAAVWLASGMLLGWGFAAQVQRMLAGLRHYGLDVGGCAVCLVVLYAGVSRYRQWRFLRQLRMARIAPEELAGLAAADASLVILDARADFQRAADPFIIPGAVFSELAAPSVPGRGPVVVYCSCPNEVSAAVVARRLQKRGVARVRPLLGGIDGWREAGYQVHPLTQTVPAGTARLKAPSEASA